MFEKLVEYFSTIPSTHRSAILIGGLVMFWSLESIIPLFRMNYAKWKHAGINLFFTLTTVIINLFFATLLYKTSEWAVNQKFGILQWIEMPLWAFTLVGLMGLDLIGAYFIHWLEHQVKWMWQFHLVHHTDTYVDTTTANRHHPGESVFRAVFTTLAVAIFGTPMWLVMLYQTLSVFFSQFNHANIQLPEKVDKVLSWIIVSPNMHKIHHHAYRPLTDTNYGNIFAIWDRIFGTFFFENPKYLQYGLDTHPDPKENNTLKGLLQMPFEPYRPPKQI